ncbi:Protein of unknown function [Lactobacillus helveticus CIRM-BIA 953]|uniref:Uncharacterized protein n=1 Tax=Lactobacillus helveticus CIRM-BIA 953 TaxID=1226335 RepID=U4QNW7_LACHE|nr:Protein of unknown function [Lactobacillus helveticus CIRM-BIA 953]
MKIVLLMDMN